MFVCWVKMKTRTNLSRALYVKSTLRVILSPIIWCIAHVWTIMDCSVKLIVLILQISTFNALNCDCDKGNIWQTQMIQSLETLKPRAFTPAIPWICVNQIIFHHWYWFNHWKHSNHVLSHRPYHEFVWITSYYTIDILLLNGVHCQQAMFRRLKGINYMLFLLLMLQVCFFWHTLDSVYKQTTWLGDTTNYIITIYDDNGLLLLAYKSTKYIGSLMACLNYNTKLYKGNKDRKNLIN